MDRAMIEKAIKICEKNKKLFEDLEISYFSYAHDEANKVLYAIRLQEDYGILCVNRNMVQRSEPNVYVDVNNHMYIASMGEKYRRTISWSSDGKQPNDEVMLVIHFPTGAYIFGDSYPVELFQEFWIELKTYDYKYVDDVNHNIYFPIDKAAPIANEFQNVLNKYYKRFKDESNIRRMAELKRELEKLEGTVSQ